MSKVKVLECHKSNTHFTDGKVYKVQEEDDKEYLIIDDAREEHYLTKEPCYRGLSYRNWFHIGYVEEEDKQNE